ncbi:helix-turn-helix domain-containing protein [Nocardia transvalensis]|nr:helix-turn-helix domain-containing protein [Nocardia transvalensis]
MKHESWCSMAEPWLTAKQAATYAKVNPCTIRHAARVGELKGHQRKPGACWKFRHWEIGVWLKGKQ